VGVAVADHELGKLAAETVVEDSGHGHAGGPLPFVAALQQAEVIGGVAEDKFVQQCGRGIGGQVRDDADSRTDDCSANRRNRRSGPGRDRIKLLPGIVNEAEAAVYFRREVLIYLEQLLVPVRVLRPTLLKKITRLVGQRDEVDERS